MSQTENTSAPVVDYDPLAGEAVNEKVYSKANATLTQAEILNDIPEPSYMPPPPSGNDDDEFDLDERPMDKGKKNTEKPGKQQPPKPEGIMPELNELDDDDKREAAKRLAETLLDGYEWAKGFGNSMCRISDKKIRRAIANGEINPNVQIPWTGGEWIKFTHFVDDFNEQAASSLKADPKFRKKIMPPLVRVLQKKGAGMSDEAFIMVTIGQDLAVSAGIVFQMRQTIKEVFAMAAEQSALMGNPNVTSQQQQAPRTTTPPINTPEPQQEPVNAIHQEQGFNIESNTAGFGEPEEATVPVVQMHSNVAQDDPDITRVTQVGRTSDGFAHVERDSAMPQFGNPETLSRLEKEGREEVVRQKRNRRSSGVTKKLTRRKNSTPDEKPKRAYKKRNQ